MKKKLICYLLASTLALIPATVSADNSERIAEIEAQIQALQEELDALKAEDSVSDTADVASDSGEETSAGIEILAEYTLPDGIGWYTRHFMIVKNNYDYPVNVQSSSMAYDAEGNIVAFDEGEIDILSAGGTSILYEAFETDSVIDHYDTEIKESKDSYYDPVDQDLEINVTDINNGIVVQIKNNGTEPAEFVEGIALFFCNGEIVDFEECYFTDDDSEIKPGATEKNQISAYNDYDDFIFYADGRR